MSNYIELSVHIDALIPARVTMPNVLKAVVKQTGVSSFEIRAHRNNRHLVEARQLFCYCARQMTANSYATIGKFINRDHSTVMSSIAQVEKRLAANPEVQDDINDVTKLAEQFAHEDRGMFVNDTRRSA